MRYEEGRIDQFLSRDKEITPQEARQIIADFKFRGRETLPKAFKEVKDHILGEDDSYIEITERELAAERGEAVRQPKKVSFLPLIVICAMFILIPLFSIFGGITGAIAIFMACFAFFGFYSAFNPGAVSKSRNFFDGQTSSGARKNGLLIGFIGLAGCIPLLLSKVLGTNGAFHLMAVTLFGAVTVFFFAGSIGSLTVKGRKYTEEVAASCTGYVRRVEERDGGEGYSRYFVVTTSPVFEYSFGGQDYKSLYDRMIDGRNADVDLGPATVFIDPDHPDDVYHRSAKVSVRGILYGLICLAVTVLLLATFIKADYTSAENRAFEFGYLNDGEHTYTGSHGAYTP